MYLLSFLSLSRYRLYDKSPLMYFGLPTSFQPNILKLYLFTKYKTGFVTRSLQTNAYLRNNIIKRKGMSKMTVNKVH